MLDFLKRGSSRTEANTTKPATGFITRLKEGLTRTRSLFSENLSTLFLGKKTIDQDLLEELEGMLISADVGVAVTDEIMKDLTRRLQRNELANPEQVLSALKEDLTRVLRACDSPLSISETHKPFVILMVGVNGTGKTTTIGKLAKQLQSQGKSVLLAAGDTFRAAAVEQLKVWGERNTLPVIAQHTGADSASVIFDAFAAAKAKKVDVLIADTAGRLHTQTNLMEELKKIIRVLRKTDPTAPHEILLVLDAGIGQNALNQAKIFHEAVGVTGLALTKLDGTAKGGILFNIAKTIRLPIRFIGIGEGIDDLKPFDAVSFVEALFELKNPQGETKHG